MYVPKNENEFETKIQIVYRFRWAVSVCVFSIDKQESIKSNIDVFDVFSRNALSMEHYKFIEKFYCF